MKNSWILSENDERRSGLWLDSRRRTRALGLLRAARKGGVSDE